MNEAILYLKSGERRAVCMPVGRAFNDLLYYIRMPADTAGKTLRLQIPGGAGLEVPAGEIASLEAAPPHVLIPDFMTDAEREKVLAFTMAHAEVFQSSGVHEAPHQRNAATDYGIRRSRVLEGPGNAPLAALIMPKLQELMPTLWSRLRMSPLPLGRLECQITAHGDGDFFAAHTDNGMPEIAHRRVSYVYYFHRDPKQFSGGHLCLYNTRFEGPYGTCGQLAADVDPPRNGLMVFPSSIWHEVTPIQCASAALTDQRLTLNGWLTI